ncbi:hypothetical protein [Desertivirga xinjiangensis]|uniref:hypothetical protein n=1 Tax=Desertivirga xinjiangensis TaxID=539206 RepID=UPI00210BF43A|nr:hypothetical protein [Pedobacter xinjiangensis]
MENKNIDKALELIDNILKQPQSKQSQKLLKKLKEQLHSATKPSGYNKKSWMQVLKELIKWAMISDKISKELIDLWTSDE